ncbi:MAG: hypothetical protein C4B58_09865 [Deltaproteobacteria bacterium]|nr:MAG: hypothetical protein C4B58_09865 [Deltaproteobacteria bacterium]
MKPDVDQPSDDVLHNRKQFTDMNKLFSYPQLISGIKNSIMKLPYVTGRPYPLDAAQILEGLNDRDCFVFLETSRIAGKKNTS